MKFIKKFKKLIVYTSIYSLIMVFNAHCYGNFYLTKSVYRWNGSIGNSSMTGRFLRSLVMIALSIIPVYGIAMLADLIILNLIEFWTGKPLAHNSLDPNIAISVQDDVMMIHNKVNNKFYYAFRDKPGKIFIKENQNFVPLDAKYENKEILLIKEGKIIEKRTLNRTELKLIEKTL